MKHDIFITETAPAPGFPFSALVGNPELRQALLLAAVDPGIGGVLISGPRGTAKSTAARALADLLPDALVDALLDVAASGVNTVERDGLSHQHAARFVLVGTMNPEEGELRPQLLDRFGLLVNLGNPDTPELRQAIVRARLAFDMDPQAVVQQQAAAQEALVTRLQAARTALARLDWPDAVLAHATALALQAGVDGVRGDLVLLRAARAHAALQGHDQVGVADVDAVAELALAHRRQVSAQTLAQPPAASAPAAHTPPTGNTNGATSPTPEGDWGALDPLPEGMAARLPTGGLVAKKA